MMDPSLNNLPMLKKTWKLGIKGFSKMILMTQLLRMRNVLKNGLE